MPVTVRYAELPEAWTEGFRTDTFTYRIRSASRRLPAEWTGTQSFRRTSRSAARDSDKFLALQDVRLTDVSLLSSEAVGELMLVNPLGFDVKIAEATYVLFAEGEPGRGGLGARIDPAGPAQEHAPPAHRDRSRLAAVRRRPGRGRPAMPPSG